MKGARTEHGRAFISLPKLRLCPGDARTPSCLRTRYISLVGFSHLVFASCSCQIGLVIELCYSSGLTICRRCGPFTKGLFLIALLDNWS